MPTYGNISEFNTANNWTIYKERIDQYFLANRVSGALEKRAILLASIGDAGYTILRSLIAPKTPAVATYDKICTAMKGHFEPLPSLIVERCRFNTRMRASGESISVFVTELKKLSEHCIFNTVLDDMLRDRLVAGVNDTKIQERLLAESKLTFQSAYDLALQIEMARKNAAELSGVGSTKSGEMNNSPAEANFVRGKPFVKSNYAGTSYGSQKKKEGSFGQCKHCGANHEALGCRFQNATCYKCRKKGHIKPICRSSAAASTSTTDSTTKFISGDMDTEDYEQSFGLYHCSGNTGYRKPYIVNLKVDTKDVDFHVDTGSSG